MKKFGYLSLFLLFFILLRYPDAVIRGASDALSVCTKNLIPSLFPFFVLSTLFIDSGLSKKIGKWLSPIMKPLFHVSGAGALPLFLGLFGGYPVGIRTATDLYRHGELSCEDYSRLAGYCNNSGPLFILGAVGIGFLKNPTYGQILLLSHILASVVTAFLFRFYIPKSRPSLPKSDLFEEKFRLSSVMEKSIGNLLSVCGFVVFFGSLLAVLEEMGFLRLLGKLFTASPDALSRGLFEITAGFSALSPDMPPQILLPLAGILLGWGGLCVHLQAVSLMEEYAFITPTYFTGKLLSCAFTALFSFLFAHFLPNSLPVAATGIYPEIISPKELTIILLVFLVVASLLFRFVATRKK